MNSNTQKKPFNKRAFISTALFISGLGLPFSGIINHELQLEPLNQARHFWMSVHNASAVLFTIFAILHISLNWRPLMNYLKNIKGIAISKEALIAMTLVIFIVGMFSLHAFHVD